MTSPSLGNLSWPLQAQDGSSIGSHSCLYIGCNHLSFPVFLIRMWILRIKDCSILFPLFQGLQEFLEYGSLSYSISLTLCCHQLQDAPLFHVLLRKKNDFQWNFNTSSVARYILISEMFKYKKKSLFLESIKYGIVERMNNEWVYFEDKWVNINKVFKVTLAIKSLLCLCKS